MRKSQLAATASAVLATFAVLAGTSASATVAPNSPGSVTTTQQLVSTNGAVPVKGDFDGDGRDDIFWYVAGSGTDYLWSGNARDDSSGTTIADRFAVTTLPITGSYVPITGDFNGDGRDDIFWYAPGPGPDSMWSFTGRGTVTSKDFPISGTYKALVADFDATDGLGADDIFWYNNSSSYLWTSNNNATFSSVAISDPPNDAKVYVGNWRQTAVSVGAPEYLDLFFYVAGTGADAIWAGNGDGQFTKSAVTVNGHYDPIVGNFDSNASGVDMTDVFWYGPGTAADSVWMNNGSSFVSQPQTVNGRYAPVVIPSREATTQDDIFWDSKTAGDFLWATNGTGGNFAYSSKTPSAWGGSDIGQRSAIPGDYNRPDPVAATAIAAGFYNTCAITTAGGVKCWGANDNGEVGNGTTSPSSPGVDVTGLTSGVISLVGGSHHMCALTSAGGVKCWGYNVQGQLGNGTTTSSSVPVDVTGLTSGVTAIGAGQYGTCAITTAGAVKCWGYNDNGQLGDGTTTQRNAPVAVAGLTSGYVSVDGGDFHNCARNSSGGLKCWGDNQFGQLGDGSTTDRSTPVDVSGLTSGTTLLEVGGYHTCAVASGGTTKCWGSNANGQVGRGNLTNATTPATVSNLASGVTALGAGELHTCAVEPTGNVKCWGSNGLGQLGDGTITQRTAPVSVTGLTSGYASLTGGQFHSCARSTSGAVKCWGNNQAGGLGDETENTSTVPVSVTTLTANEHIAGNADVLWWTAGDATGESEVLWYDLDSLN